ncbi:hypothetical protein RB595_002631 [Gaeumannomyces hyphopodioides]
MNHLLFERLVGDVDQKTFARLHTTRLLHSFHAAPHHRFDGGEQSITLYGSGAAGPSRLADENERRSIWAHKSGVNALALERFDGRVLASGGSDGTIRLWDLEQCRNPHRPHTYRPTAQIARETGAGQLASSAIGADKDAHRHQHHRFGITHLSFFPFDADAFLSSSYDQTLKVWATEPARLSGSFDLGAKVYTHATSPIASHLLVACATQHPAVRLVDLRSGAAVQSLMAAGQIGAAAGAVLSAAWSPTREHVLASGAVDGTVRVWDVRRANALVALLDQEDSLGILRRAGGGVASASVPGRAGAPDATLSSRGIRASAKAHTGPVNGLAWTDNGDFIVSAGHDRRVRVWDAVTGANTLVNYGPSIRNGGLMSVNMFVSPTGLAGPGPGSGPTRRDVLFWPNGSEVLALDLHEGTIIRRLRVAGGGASVQQQQQAAKNRVTSLAWRGAGGFGSSSGHVVGGRNAAGGVYSGHSDGQIRVWAPELEGPEGDEFGVPEESEEAAAERTRKRKALDNVYKNLMGQNVRFQ